MNEKYIKYLKTPQLKPIDYNRNGNLLPYLMILSLKEYRNHIINGSPPHSSNHSPKYSIIHSPKLSTIHSPKLSTIHSPKHSSISKNLVIIII